MRRLALGHATTPQLSSAAVDGGGLGFRDPDGNDLGSIGIGDDGGFVIDYTGGPKPPRPSPPTVSADAGIFRIEWDGAFENAGDSGVLATSDTDRVEIHASMDESFVPDRVESFGGAFATIDGGSFALGPLPEAGTYYFRLVARSKSAQFSEPSERVEQELAITSIDLAVTDAWLTGDAAQNTADGKNGIWRGPEAPPEDPDAPFTNGDIWFEMNDDGESIPNIWDEDAGEWVSNRDARQSAIEKVQTELREDLDSIVVDGSGTKNFYRGTMPTDAESSEGDLWFDSSDENKPYIYEDGVWITVRDSFIEDESVTTSKLAVGAITAESGIIGSINAGTITVGEMNGARIKAQTIAADKLLIGGIAPLNTNPEFSDGLTGWASKGSPTVSGSVVTLPRKTSISTAALAVTPGQVLRVRAITSGGDVSSTGVGLSVYNATPADPTGNVSIGFNSGNTGQAPGAVIGDHRVTIPAGWTHVRIAAEKGNAGDAATVYSLGAYNAAGATLIQDGSISAEHIKVGAITAESGIIGSIDANVITSGKIMGNQIDGDAINGKTITGAKIRTASSGSRVELSHNGLKQYNSLGATIVDMTAGSFALEGGEIVGSTIKTSKSGYRVELTSKGLKQYGKGDEVLVDMTGGQLDLKGNLEQTNNISDLSVGPAFADGVSPGLHWKSIGGTSQWAGVATQNSAEGPTLITQGPGTGTWLIQRDGHSHLRNTRGSGGSWLTMSDETNWLTWSHPSNGGSTQLRQGDRHFQLGSWDGNGDAVGFLKVDPDKTTLSGYKRDLELWGDDARMVFRQDDSGPQIHSKTIRKRSYTGNSANVYITGFGTLGVGSSARRFKADEEVIERGSYEDALLSINYKSWLDREELRLHEEYLAFREGHPMEPVPARLGEAPQEPPERVVGGIAEDFVDAGLLELVQFDELGRTQGINYDRIGVALIPIVRDQRDQIAALQARLSAVEAA